MRENYRSTSGCGPRLNSLTSASSWANMPAREAIMVVGHNPNLSQFLGAIISDSGCESIAGTEKGCGCQGRDPAYFGRFALVRYAEAFADALRHGGRKFPAKHFAEIGGLFFDRPQLQIHSHAPAWDQS